MMSTSRAKHCANVKFNGVKPQDEIILSCLDALAEMRLRIASLEYFHNWKGSIK